MSNYNLSQVDNVLHPFVCANLTLFSSSYFKEPQQSNQNFGENQRNNWTAAAEASVLRDKKKQWNYLIGPVFGRERSHFLLWPEHEQVDTKDLPSKQRQDLKYLRSQKLRHF